MSGIRVATGLHILWGIYLTLFWWRVPRPFGAFEPFFGWLNFSPFWLGILFLFIATLALAKNLVLRSPTWWLAPILAVPQQFVLMLGLVGSAFDVFIYDEPDRAYLALCYIFPITVMHCADLFKLWHVHLLHREAEL